MPTLFGEENYSPIKSNVRLPEMFLTWRNAFGAILLEDHVKIAYMACLAVLPSNNSYKYISHTQEKFHFYSIEDINLYIVLHCLATWDFLIRPNSPSLNSYLICISNFHKYLCFTDSSLRLEHPCALECNTLFAFLFPYSLHTCTHSLLVPSSIPFPAWIWPLP